MIVFHFSRCCVAPWLCTCLHLSSAPFLSPSACSARSIAFSLSSFSICIFFLMASMFLQFVSSQQSYPDRDRDLWRGQMWPGAREELVWVARGELEDGIAHRLHETQTFFSAWTRAGKLPIFRQREWSDLCAWRLVFRVCKEISCVFMDFTARASALHLQRFDNPPPPKKKQLSLSSK